MEAPQTLDRGFEKKTEVGRPGAAIPDMYIVGCPESEWPLRDSVRGQLRLGLGDPGKYTPRRCGHTGFPAATAASVRTHAPESCPALSLVQPRAGEHSVMHGGAGESAASPRP